MSESMVSWKAALGVMSILPVSEDRLEIRTEAQALQPGDQVVVTTKVGRTMMSGVVASVAEGTVTLRCEHDRLRAYPSDLYNFLKVTTQESKNEIDEVNLGRTVPHPETKPATGMRDSAIQVADTGPTPILAPGTADDNRPAIKIISKYIVGDVRWANEIWSDMTSIGKVRTMRKHSLGADTMGQILADLALNKIYGVD
jgi:hypothetical protein